MKVKVNYEASQTQKTKTYDVLDDFGIESEIWKEMSEEAKNEILEEAIEHDALYWAVDRVEEIEEDES